MAGEKEEVQDPSQPIRYVPDPFEMTNLGDVLTRRYLVGSFEWSEADVAGTNLLVIDFPHALYLKPFLWMKMSRFRYFRANVKVTIELNGNTGAAGALLCWHTPYTPRTLSPNEQRL